MTTYSQRYASGEHESVWNDLRALGPVPDHLREDVADVAAQTMRRASAHLWRLAEDAPAAGLAPRHAPVRTAATAEDHALVEVMDREVGGLPAALIACLCEIGRFSLVGEWPEIGLHYMTTAEPGSGPSPKSLPDPLELLGAKLIHGGWELWWEDHVWERERGYSSDPFGLYFAPAEVHMATYPRRSRCIEVPDTRADPLILDVEHRPGITLVEYLRAAVAWGGFPGWEFAEVPVPEVLNGLRRQPDF